MKKIISAFVALAACFFCFAAEVGAIVRVENQTPQVIDVEYQNFYQRLNDFFSGQRGELGGDCQNYILVVTKEQDAVVIYLEGSIEPLWQIRRSELDYHKRALIYQPTLWADEAGNKIYNKLLRLEQFRHQEDREISG